MLPASLAIANKIITFTLTYIVYIWFVSFNDTMHSTAAKRKNFRNNVGEYLSLKMYITSRFQINDYTFSTYENILRTVIKIP